MKSQQEIWTPLPGPQTEALESQADILFYGGQAGGGKTDLLIGTALTQHLRSIIYRREGTQLQGIFQRMAEILGTRDGFNSQSKIWSPPGMDDTLIEFGSAQHPGDEIAYQGRPHDLIGFDEITHFLESQFRFLMGWLRSTVPGQRKRVICTGNPPTDSDGDWVIDFWGPWLDPDHPNPAKPGELRWYAVKDGKDHPVDNSDPVWIDGEKVYPQSRTFIPSAVQDNPYLMQDTAYLSTLQALPEPLRSQMLKGDFTAGREDDPWQIIPTDWVEKAMERWDSKTAPGVMDSVGFDPARGGNDNNVLIARHGTWFNEPVVIPGSGTPDGAAGASLAVMHVRDSAPIHVDVIGIGSSVYDHLNKGAGVHAVGFNASHKSHMADRSGTLKFINRRAEVWWKMREALDPKNGEGLALPPDRNLKRDLCAPRFKVAASGIQVESKDDLIKRIGRSTDWGDACVMANMRTAKRAAQNDDRDRDLPTGSGSWMM